jgi:hypothetical protein
MQRRSWMAALTLAAMAGALTGPSIGAEGPTPIKQKVAINLRLSGLRYPGEVAVKPGGPGCRFKPFTQAIKNNNLTPLDPFEVEVFSADRDFSVVITLREPGQPDKTIRRIFRVDAPSAGQPAVKPFECLLTANSLSQPATVAEKPAGETSTKK